MITCMEREERTETGDQEINKVIKIKDIITSRGVSIMDRIEDSSNIKMIDLSRDIEMEVIEDTSRKD